MRHWTLGSGSYLPSDRNLGPDPGSTRRDGTQTGPVGGRVPTVWGPCVSPLTPGPVRVSVDPRRSYPPTLRIGRGGRRGIVLSPGWWGRGRGGGGEKFPRTVLSFPGTRLKRNDRFGTGEGRGRREVDGGGVSSSKVPNPG